MTADARRHYPEPLRRVRYVDPETKKRLSFLTNNFVLPALTMAQLYRSRWQVELFFKWIKQHLRIKAFYGTSENAVKTQIWIALSVYVLVAIVKKRLALNVSLYKLLQILSVTLFEKMPISTAVLTSPPNSKPSTTLTNCLYSTYDRTAVPISTSHLCIAWPVRHRPGDAVVNGIEWTVTLSDKGPAVLMFGNNPRANGTFNAGLAGIGTPSGLAFIRAEPRHAAWLAVRKVLYFCSCQVPHLIHTTSGPGPPRPGVVPWRSHYPKGGYELGL